MAAEENAPPTPAGGGTSGFGPADGRGYGGDGGDGNGDDRGPLLVALGILAVGFGVLSARLLMSSARKRGVSTRPR